MVQYCVVATLNGSMIMYEQQQDVLSRVFPTDSFDLEMKKDFNQYHTISQNIVRQSALKCYRDSVTPAKYSFSETTR